VDCVDKHNQCQINFIEKLIVDNQNLTKINSTFPDMKDAVMLDELYSFDVPLSTVAIGTVYQGKNSLNIGYVLFFTQLGASVKKTAQQTDTCIIDNIEIWNLAL